jgi:hypothetical protein
MWGYTSPSHLFIDYTADDLKRLVSTNLQGSIYITQLAVKQMLAQKSGGGVVSITASLADNPIAGINASIAMITKGGLNAVTRSLAIEYAKDGIRVNAVAPGVVDTPLHKTDPKEVLRGRKGPILIDRAVIAVAGFAAAMAAPSLALAHVLLVNGEVITNYDIGQRTKFNTLASYESPPRQEVIEELIDDKLKAQVAYRYKIDLTDKDVDQQYAKTAKRIRISADQPTRQLPQGHADVGYDYTLRPILFLAQRSDATALEARRKEAEALRTRFTDCETGLPAARAQRGVVIREPITKNSFDLARSLLTEPPVYLIDEPTAGIDPRTSEDIYDLIASLARDAGKAILLVDQDIKNALAIADYVYVVKNGSVASQGSRTTFGGDTDALVAR